MQNIKVFKFGGSSVGLPERMHKVANIINTQEKKIVVLSAISGTTNALIEIRNEEDTSKALEKINTLKDTHINFAFKLLNSQNLIDEANTYIEERFKQIEQIKKAPINQEEENIIFAQGELLSTKLFHLYLREIGIKAKLVSALECIKLNDQSLPDKDFIKSKLTSLLNKETETTVFITQGFICIDSNNKISTLQRGGSDYSASIIGAAVSASIIEIWTDIDGMHNNDPRCIKNTYSIKQLSFDEAAELAYFGAKVLHPQCIFPAQEANIPVKILSTIESTAEGTLINNEHSAGVIKAIAAKDNITLINIHSIRMLMAYGFLKKVFEVFDLYKISIDIITTSEVTITISIDDTT
ncbi:MAG: aspartate kinase [Solitalea-like symbiont of Acarus siro]